MRSREELVRSIIREPFWNEPDSDKAARKLYSQAQALEVAQYGRRYRAATLYRLVTGEDVPLMFGYWMSPRVAPALGAFSSAAYAEPAVNVVASAVETFENRIGTLQPFVEIDPTGMEFRVRDACQKREDYVDGIFDYQKVYDKTRLCFRDSGTWGTAWMKVTSDGDEIVIERVPDDEMLIDEVAAINGNPAYLIQRRYMTKEELLERHGDTDEKVSAIRQAPLAFTGSFWAIKSTVEMVAVIEAWRLPHADGSEGRHMLVLPNKHLVDEPWTRSRFPFAILRWTPQSMGFRGQGCAMQLLPYQVEINRHVDLIHENQLHFGPNRWLVEGNSKIRTEQLGARPGAITRYMGAKPEAHTATPNSPEMYTSLQNWIDRAYLRVGLNQQTAAGLKQPGITSGRALRTMLQIEDSRNKALQIALERFVKDIAELVLEEAEAVKPTVDSRGVLAGPLRWDDVKGDGRVGVFPVSSLPSDPPGRQQQIADWYADGTIDRRAYFRLQQMPDVKAFAILATAADDLIESTLDNIVRTGKYEAPEAFSDPETIAQALKMGLARYYLEKRLKTDPKTLRLLQRWISAAAELASDPAGQVMAPAAPGGAPPVAAPPVQVSPTIAPPAQLAAA
jgi:hypothetical protein